MDTPSLIDPDRRQFTPPYKLCGNDDDSFSPEKHSAIQLIFGASPRTIHFSAVKVHSSVQLATVFKTNMTEPLSDSELTDLETAWLEEITIGGFRVWHIMSFCFATLLSSS